MSNAVKEYYNAGVENEWVRIEGRPEFLITSRYLNRYIKPGDAVLDVGGGPGRYALPLAEKGCDVVLLDLADENVKFAEARAAEQGMKIQTICGDACEVDTLVEGQFDHILLMGPLYHLISESERTKAVNACISLLKPGGIIYVSFISLISGVIYAMRLNPGLVGEASEKEFFESFVNDRYYSGPAFTEAYFATQKEILPFMSQFPLEKMHLLGQESILTPCERNIMSQPQEIIDLWIDLAEKVCEREELLSWAEHIMFIGRKK